jgi:hypothetical protein
LQIKINIKIIAIISKYKNWDIFLKLIHE